MFLFLMLSVVIAFTVIYISMLVYKHFHAIGRLNFYSSQGVTILPGANRFIIGNVPEVAKWAKAPKVGD